MTIEKLKQEAEEKIQSRDSKTCIFVSASSQSDNLIDKVQSALAKQSAAFNVLPAGSFGYDGIEPFMIVVKPGMPKYVYGNLTAASAKEVVRDCVIGDDLRPELAAGKIGEDSSEIPNLFALPFFKVQQRIALRNCGLIDPEDIEDYIAQGGYSELVKALSNRESDLICKIGSSGIHEIGDCTRELENQWRTYHDVQGDEKVVVCNAVRRDIDDGSVRLLLESDPHMVLEGLMLAGYAVGASKGYIVVNQGNITAIRRMEVAIGQMSEKGLLGEDIFGSGYSFDMEIRVFCDAVVNREDTAVVGGLSGERAMPFVTDAGSSILQLQQNPVCINSVETLAKIPAVLANASGWYRGIGTDKCNGTKIVSLHGDVMNSGVIELPFDTSLRDVVFDVGGGIVDDKEFKAVLVGGITGGFIPERDLESHISYEDMAKFGICEEAGVVRVLNNARCIVWETKEIMSAAQCESCGKCVMCREGTYQLQRILADITEGKAKSDDILLIEEISNGMKMVSVCGYGHEAANPVITALNSFKEEFDAHIVKKLCPALVCKRYITFHILGDKCTGCGKCQQVCPTDAIHGEDGLIHVVDKYDCIKCGECIDVCPDDYSAVVKAGLIKPRTPKEPIPVGSWKRR